MATERSARHMERARGVIPRGCSSAARLRTRGPTPVLAEASGCRVTDLDGNVYIDYYTGFGPPFLGHRAPVVMAAVRGFLDGPAPLNGGPVAVELELAELVRDLVPCAELVTFQTSGSEAIQLAIRVARATTGRPLVIKFDGQYHGWLDPVFVNTLGQDPVSGPVPLEVRHAVPGAPVPTGVLVAPWNDADALASLLASHPEQVACVLMEAVPCNSGSYLPQPGYLEAARRLCDRHGALLVFDEVITGFRVALGGAQKRFGVTPDLAVFAKAMASGFPVAALAGSRVAMASAADGAVRTSGTYNATGPALAASIATLTELRTRAGEIYPRLERLGAALREAIETGAAKAGVPLHAEQIGGVLQLIWRPQLPIRSYADVRTCDQGPVAAFTDALLAHGVLIPERGLCLLTAAHDDDAIAQTVAAIAAVFEDADSWT